MDVLAAAPRCRRAQRDRDLHGRTEPVHRLGRHGSPDSEVDALSGDLLLALLDLRQTVVRRLSDMGPDGE